jgi:signal transduction histidine kinase
VRTARATGQLSAFFPVPVSLPAGGAVTRTLLAGFSGLVLVGFLLLVSTTLWDKRSHTVAEAARTRQNLARTLEQYVIGRVRAIDLVLGGLAGRLDAELRQGPLDADRVQRLLAAEMHPDSLYRDLVVYDADGNRVVNAVNKIERFNAGERDYFTTLRDHPEIDFYISRPFLSIITKVWSLGFSHRLRKPDGSFGGVVLAPLNISGIEEFFASLDVGRDGNITLGDGTATHILARYPVNPGLLDRVFDKGQLYELVRAGHSEGTFESISTADGVDRMLTFRRVGELPLVISVAQSGPEVLADWRREFWTYGIAAAIGMAILVLLTAGLWWQLTRQQRLVDALRASETAMRETNLSLHKAIMAAEAASRTKSEFLACMSHELRTPLNAVIGFAELISGGSLRDATKIRDYAEDIRLSGRHLLRVITDILEMSRIEGGTLELDEAALDVAALIAACLRQVEPRARQGGVALRSTVGEGLPPLRGDEKRLTQVLLNLLSNGIKFTKPGGAVSLDAAVAPDGGLTITVADSGIGMSEAELAIAMEPFRQADSRLSRRYDGAGLGLPLAKALVELQGGRLTLASTPGSGTTARIAFPRDRLMARASARETAITAHSGAD